MNRWTRTFAAAALVGCTVITGSAGNAGAEPTQAWTSRYAGPGSGSDRATAIAFDGAGNVYVTGQSVNGAAGIDYVTVKYDASGAQQWVRFYNGPGNGEDFPNAIAADDAGNVYVTGASRRSGTFNPPEFAKDIATVKYDTDGNEQWVARYNGPVGAWDEGLAIVVDPKGGVFVTGRSNNSGIWFDFDYVTINYTALGAEQWVARFNGPGDDWDQSNAIAIDGEGNVYVTGVSEQQLGTAFMDYATVKYNSAGEQQWVSTYNGTGNNSDEANDVDVDAAGNVYITGHSATSTGQNWEYATVKYNSAGVEQWARTYNNTGASPDVARFIAVGGDGSVHVTGASLLDYATVKYDTDGTEQWVRRLGAGGDDIPGAIALDGTGSVYVTGWSAGNYATVKYDAGGTQEWLATFNGPAGAQDSASAVAVSSEGTVYVTGYSTGLGTGPDYATIKYTQAATGVGPGVGASSVVLSQNSPNPFRALTTIAFEAPANARGNVTLRVYDAGGRQVATLFDAPVSGAGARAVTWNAAGHPSGAYFYRLEAGDVTRSGKMVLMK